MTDSESVSRLSNRRFYRTTAVREYRLRRGITLARVAIGSGLSANRVSELERHPDLARPGELGRLKAAVDRLAETNRDFR